MCIPKYKDNLLTTYIDGFVSTMIKFHQQHFLFYLMLWKALLIQNAWNKENAFFKSYIMYFQHMSCLTS